MGIIESDVRTYLKTELTKIRIVTQPYVSSIKGDPDLICFRTMAQVFFIETKRPVGGVVSEHQKARHLYWARMGFPVHVIWTKIQVDALIASLRRR